MSSPIPGDGAACLSIDEQDRVSKFVFERDQQRFLRSRVALRYLLASCLNCEPNQLGFSYNEQGKPALSGYKFEFNLSHANGLVLIAVSGGGSVGIDLENIGHISDWQAVAKRSFSPAERTALSNQPAELQEMAFYRIWTQKEAYGKALGEGYSYGFPQFTVMSRGEADAGLEEDVKNPHHPDRWSIKSIETKAGYVAALAHDQGRDVTIRQQNFLYP
ncbi:MAG: 4'-phosphopantetheinyl transferase superfamily protein [Gammaproteobacteria bacterium]|nr:4'-phosphopantetheinyl transferase superfamily protein [Gammaproteobacteria bacterium]